MHYHFYWNSLLDYNLTCPKIGYYYIKIKMPKVDSNNLIDCLIYLMTAV